MRHFRFPLPLVAIVGSVFCLAYAAPRKLLSPPGKAQLSLAGARITVTYHRPKIRNPKTGAPRKIFGPGPGYLVPFDKVWRLGANQATTLITTKDLRLAGHRLPAGTYTLFAIPAAHRWTLIVSRKTGEWGIPYPGQQYDFARIPLAAHRTGRLVDPFTISLSAAGARQARLSFAWEHTVVVAPIRVSR